jgi:hypothetical protein
MILPNVDTTPTYEAMLRGEWPEPNPEVVAAHKALNIEVIDVETEGAAEGERPTDAPEKA